MSSTISAVNREMRTFHCDLAHDVQQRFRSRCPCCDRVMVRPKRGKKPGSDRITVAHDVAVGDGGDETIWVYACLACNSDQRNLSFFAWSLHLACVNDPRAPRVAALAEIVLEYRRRKNDRQTASMAASVPAHTEAAE